MKTTFFTIATILSLTFASCGTGSTETTTTTTDSTMVQVDTTNAACALTDSTIVDTSKKKYSKNLI
jgi:hypothetical protein